MEQVHEHLSVGILNRLIKSIMGKLKGGRITEDLVLCMDQTIFQWVFLISILPVYKRYVVYLIHIQEYQRNTLNRILFRPARLSQICLSAFFLISSVFEVLI